MRTIAIAATITITALLGSMAQGQASEVTILSSSGSTPILQILAAAFEKSTGHKAIVSGQQSQVMKQKIDTDAPGDLVAQASDQLDDLVKRGKVVAGTVKDYARAGNGVAVKAGAPKPDISTPEAFKRAMLAAKSIGHTDSGTGPFNTRLFQKLGIYDEIKNKIKIIDGGRVGTAVAAGDVEIGIQQASVIMSAPGTDFVGPIPADLTEYSHYGIGVLTVSKDPETARAFISFLGSPAAGDTLRRNAMEPVP